MQLIYTFCLYTVVYVLNGVICLHGEEEYSYSEYPHSLMEKEECGRENSDKPIYVCDPNRILKNEDGMK